MDAGCSEDVDQERLGPGTVCRAAGLAVWDVGSVSGHEPVRKEAVPPPFLASAAALRVKVAGDRLAGEKHTDLLNIFTWTRRLPRRIKT